MTNSAVQEIPNYVRHRNYQFRPFEASDAEILKAQARQTKEFERFSQQYGPEGWAQIAAHGRAFSGFDGDRILGFAGFIEFWPSRWMGWATLSNTVDRYDMVWIHRIVKQAIADVPHRVRRLEITVLKEFYNGHRWAEMLGFQSEGVLRRYDQLARDHVGFSLIRD